MNKTKPYPMRLLFTHVSSTTSHKLFIFSTGMLADCNLSAYTTGYLLAM